ncbi:MAG TPA: hybrid sensor histidine kinase/response regulator, partial [Ktedonobacterales bacterium]|nr:hybrid sensor histidine kinase/response regulator [Ktedonobacterales bacterium]
QTPDVSPVIPIPDGEQAPRVLVVGDDATGATVGAILRMDGYTVRLATTTTEADALLRAEPFDIILTDLRLSDAPEVDMLARAQELVPRATFIALTGYATLESALHALRAGAYGYLVKPIDRDELRITVGRAQERRRLERELATRVRELEEAHKQMTDFNRRLQQQVEQATVALRERVVALDEANQLLQRTQEQHDRFVAMVAHEMRGPLNPIINYAQLARRPTSTQEARERYMDIIVEHAFRLNRMVDDLQTATRLSTGQFTLRRTRQDVAALAADLVEQFTASTRDRTVTLERPDEPVFALVDRDRITQAVRNLLDNAVKYSSPTGAIEVKVWHDMTHAHISVGDYGVGIPEAERKRIFEAFTRLQDRNSEVAGSGLGLYITRGIVAAHEGILDVSNRSGDERAQGAIFTISLPLAEDETVETPGAPGVSQAEKATESH